MIEFNKHDVWYFVSVAASRQLSLHELFVQESESGKKDAITVWTPTDEKVQVLKSRLIASNNKRGGRSETISYAVPLHGGILYVKLPSEAAERRLQRYIKHSKDVHELVRDKLKPDEPIAFMTNEQRDITEAALREVRKQARRKGSIDRRYKNIKPEGFDYKEDSKKNRQKKYSQSELIYPEFEEGDEVKILSGPFVGFKVTVEGKMKQDDTIKVHGHIFNASQKMNINVFALQKVS